MKALGLLLLLAGAGRAAPPKDRFASFGGAEVRYRTSGKGPEALVFVHGWAGAAALWRLQEGAFPRTRVVIVDLPGHGRSGAPRTSYTLDYFARSLDAVLRDAGIERAVLVGHSMGAPIIGRFYGLYPEKTLGLVIVDGAMRPFMPKQEMDKLLDRMRKDYKAEVAPIADSYAKPVKDARLRKEIRAAMLAAPDFVGISSMEGMADETAYERGPIRVPVLAVLARSHAGAEPFLRSLAPGLELQVWDGVSHFLMMEKPRDFNGAVGAFLEKNNLLKYGKPR